jgi:ribosome-associated translation inhibitor RaiA
MDVDVTMKGDVAADASELAVEKIGGLDRFVNAKLLRAQVVLRQEANPRIERPARAEGEILLDGTMVRASVADISMEGSIDHLARTLERQLRRFVDRRVTERDRPRSGGDGEWRRGDYRPPRPGFFPRPPDERRVIRRKSIAVVAMKPVEAAEEMELLDHDFYLFCEAESGVDAVVYHRDDDRLGVIGPAETGWSGVDADGIVRETSRGPDPRDLDSVIAEMGELDHRFLYFIDEESGRGHVIYLRYDGHYGLIEPRDPEG